MNNFMQWWAQLSWAKAALVLVLAVGAALWIFILLEAARPRRVTMAIPRRRPRELLEDWDSFAVKWRGYYVQGSTCEEFIDIERIDGQPYGFGPGETSWDDDTWEDFKADLFSGHVGFCRP